MSSAAASVDLGGRATGADHKQMVKLKAVAIKGPDPEKDK
jgi:hypothetical protein